MSVLGDAAMSVLIAPRPTDVERAEKPVTTIWLIYRNSHDWQIGRQSCAYHRRH